eukprot:TRINITY_DN1837_c0_g1_i2.p1 TRINITY_DN1837_c0_g1~~TRINITY_DN1837_c0_g1_i2.p1  ORF type:complete len:522 (+),score=158.65 TRINITY_DN1837_c0_g1_i2:330-1895(+)
MTTVAYHAMPNIISTLGDLEENEVTFTGNEVSVGSEYACYLLGGQEEEEEVVVQCNSMLYPTSLSASAASPTFDSASQTSIHDNASFSGDNESSEERRVKSLDFEENPPRESIPKRANLGQFSNENPFVQKDNLTSNNNINNDTPSSRLLKVEEKFQQKTIESNVELKAEGVQTIGGTSLPFSEANGQFEVKEKIGEGTFSSVYKAIPVNRKCYGIGESESFVALKRIYPTCSPLRILNEMQHLKRLGGKHHVLPLYGTLRCRDQVTLVVPYVPHDKFKDFVISISLEEMKKYMRALFESLQHLHSNGVIHRDIKPGNFLCNLKEDKFMLVDFGLAELVPPSNSSSSGISNFRVGIPHQSNVMKQQLDSSLENSRKRRLEEMNQQMLPSLSDHSKMMQNSSLLNFRRCTSVESMTQRKPHIKQKVLHAPRAGTRGFRAPEILLKCQNQTTAIDIWSAGVIFLCILSTRYPFFNSPDDLASLAEISAVFGTKEVTLAAELLGRRVRFPTEIVKTELSVICKK